MLIDHQHGPLPKVGNGIASRFKTVQQTADRIGQPEGRLVAAMGQEGIEPDVQPAVPQLLHMASDRAIGCRRPPAVTSLTGAVLFTQDSQLQCGFFKLSSCFFQRLLKLRPAHHTAVRERHKGAGGGEGVAHKGLNLGHVHFEVRHTLSSFARRCRSVGDVVMMSYSCWEAWKAMGTWL